MTAETVAVRDFDTANHESSSGFERVEVEALPYSETHGYPRFAGVVDNRQWALQALSSMTEFWKRPKFWIGAILILWIGYLLTANLSQTLNIFIIPRLLHPQISIAYVMVVAAIVGSLLTLFIQYTWRRRSSKNAASSATVSNSSTVA
jgi:hypothetical protein